ncbi:DNA gyrase inhibitor YacG [Neisseria sp. HMSC075C12]|uniref:DNA gyrase inhibitor YacG n=1 Tax=Neisseria sp. HMSC075C12 TaxID=1739282 RepID=UPI0008A4C8C0|nr:DNA gyrase inhibitor YacG [Neisseria sp. HMSC075C12]OFL26969.1 DNA gyrase inhibitor [Neisseria sp. HMSC075C12]
MTAPVVKCPPCHKKVVWNTDSPYRPFCSKRCKLIDLGEWAQEKYTVSSEDDPFSDLLNSK